MCRMFFGCARITFLNNTNQHRKRVVRHVRWTRVCVCWSAHARLLTHFRRSTYVYIQWCEYVCKCVWTDDDMLWHGLRINTIVGASHDELLCGISTKRRRVFVCVELWTLKKHCIHTGRAYTQWCLLYITCFSSKCICVYVCVCCTGIHSKNLALGKRNCSSALLACVGVWDN